MGNIPWYAKYTIGLAGLLLTVYAMIVAKSALVPLTIAIFLAVLLASVCQRLEDEGIRSTQARQDARENPAAVQRRERTTDLPISCLPS